MSQKGIKIHFGEIGDIPARTCVTFEFSQVLTNELMQQVMAVPDGSKIYVDPSEVTRVYFCMDCEYETRNLQEMLDHQHKDKHTWWQAIRRFFGGSYRKPSDTQFPK